jgi:hypothetical protein
MLGLQNLITEGATPRTVLINTARCVLLSRRTRTPGCGSFVSHPVDKVSLPKSFPSSRDLQKLGDAEVRGTVPLL